MIFYAENLETLKRVLKTAVEGFETLGVSISLDDNGDLRYCNVGHNRNLDNILFSALDEVSILKSLARHPFDLQNGETLKIVIQTKDFAIQYIFVCTILSVMQIL